MNKRLNDRQEHLYYRMKNEATRGYEHFQNWEWTITEYWSQDEKRFDFKRIKEYTLMKSKWLELDYKLNVINKDKYNFENAILSQVIKFCDERIKILYNI